MRCFWPNRGRIKSAVQLLGSLDKPESPMIVYGDFERRERTVDMKASVAGMLRNCRRLAAGIDRHAALVGAFIRAAELVQGIADAEFDIGGRDIRATSQQQAGAN